MKYKSLKDKKQELKKNHKKSSNNEFKDGFEQGVDNSFDLFASYVDQYKRYKDDVKLLMKEQKNVWTNWVKYYENQSNVDTANYINKYNEWLFDYMFSNINEETDSFLSL